MEATYPVLLVPNCPCKILNYGKSCRNQCTQKTVLELQNKNGKHARNPDKNTHATNVKEENAKLRKYFCSLLCETIEI